MQQRYERLQKNITMKCNSYWVYKQEATYISKNQDTNVPK